MSFFVQCKVRGRLWFPAEVGWLARQIRPFVGFQVAGFLCITAGSFLALLTPLVLKWLIDRILPQRNVALLLLAVALMRSKIASIRPTTSGNQRSSGRRFVASSPRSG